MKASIIVPSYNSKERLYYNLISLNHQDYPHGDFEVIVIDNGSTDNTMEMLANFNADYPLLTVRIDQNRGIAHGRNQGLIKASGDILIFHDSDMIAPRDFVRKHIEAHTDDNTIICGLSWRRVFSYYYNNFTPYQVEIFKRFEHKYPPKEALANAAPYRLLSEQQIIDGSFMEDSFDLEMGLISALKDILQRYGEDFASYRLPWRFFLTNNASVSRSKVFSVGLFDENIVKYGFEDYDLGIRLYKSGGQYKIRHDIVSVHQEHPTNSTFDAMNDNLNYICEKYDHIYFVDVHLACLCYHTSLNPDEVNEIMEDIYRLYGMEQYHGLVNLFLGLLQTVRKRYYPQPNQDISQVLSKGILPLAEIIRQSRELYEGYGMHYFIKALYTLIRDVYQVDMQSI